MIVDGIFEYSDDGKTLLKCLDERIPSVVIPGSIRTIGDSAFSGCKYLESVVIPDSVISIGDSAFYDCKSLKSVSIPDSVNSIGNGAFGFCNSLKFIEIGKPNTNYFSDKGVVYSKDYSTLVAYPAGRTDLSFEIPNSVKSIGGGAFSGCKALRSVTIPDSVKFIGDEAFIYCKSLASVDIPESVNSIGKCAFCGCKALRSVTIPDSVRSIGDCAFYECISLTTVSLSESLDYFMHTFNESATIIKRPIPISDNIFSPLKSILEKNPDMISDDPVKFISCLKDLQLKKGEYTMFNTLITSEPRAFSMLIMGCTESGFEKYCRKLAEDYLYSPDLLIELLGKLRSVVKNMNP